MMKYSSRPIVVAYILILTAASGSCWQFFTSLQDYTLHNSIPDPVTIHSEYWFGDCRRPTKELYGHIHIDHIDVLGKIIMRGWVNVPRIPTCIQLRATAFELDTFRSTAYNFQLCVPRITYCHTHHRYKYYYYEWYLPVDLIGGMNWDMIFYGPPGLEWQ